MSINPRLYPYISSQIIVRRYEKTELFDLKRNESYEIDEEALLILKLSNGSNSISDIIAQFPQEKQEEILEGLKYFAESEIIDYKAEKKSEERLSKLSLFEIPERNPFEMPYLRTLMVNITEKCNLRCDHCYITDKHQTDFPLNKLKILIEDFFQLQGLKLVLTGGEPFLYSNFKKLLVYLQEIPLQKIILSNAVLIKNNLEIIDLMEDNIHEIYVSLDGLEETHNEIRKANCFQETIEGIKILLDHGFKVSINTMVHKLNLPEFDDLRNFIKDLGPISSWLLDIPTFDDSIPLGVKEKYGITPAEVKNVFGKYGWGSGFEYRAGNQACGPGLMAIDVMGVVSKCGFFTKQNIGNILDLGVKKSWELVQKNLNWCLDDLKCNEIGCEYLQNCRGGCRYRAFTNTGDILGVDKYRCVQFGKD